MKSKVTCSKCGEGLPEDAEIIVNHDCKVWKRFIHEQVTGAALFIAVSLAIAIYPLLRGKSLLLFFLASCAFWLFVFFIDGFIRGLVR